jgi:hypothetical protein
VRAKGYAGQTLTDTGVAADFVPQPPLGRDEFHPGAVGPEHHGNELPPELEEEFDAGKDEPNKPNMEKEDVVQEIVLLD